MSICETNFTSFICVGCFMTVSKYIHQPKKDNWVCNDVIKKKPCVFDFVQYSQCY